jgi:CelD/BcsL family acetyltransferase involved in cellulose biosynthesis
MRHAGIERQDFPLPSAERVQQPWISDDAAVSPAARCAHADVRDSGPSPLKVVAGGSSPSVEVPRRLAPLIVRPGRPAEPVAIAPRTLSTTVAHTPDALELHLEAWEDLVANVAEPNPFFEPHALLPSWRQLPGTDLQVVLVWAPHPLPGKPAILVGLFPIVREPRFKGLPLTAYATWTHLYAYLATPLVRADRASEAIEALFAWLRETDAAVFEWRTLGSDGAFRHALIDALNRLGLESFRERSHTRALFRPAADAEAYLAHAIGGKKRKELRRQERRLAETGALTYDELAPDGDLEAWLDEFVALEARGWKGQGGTSLGDDPAGLAVFRAIARGAFARGQWMTLALRLDGRAIAMKCNVRCSAGAQQGAVAFKIAYDEAFSRFSPGVLLELEHIRRLHEPGAPSWMDSGAAPNHPMIDHLWRDRRSIETIVVPTGRSLGGFAVAVLPLARGLSRTVRDAAHHLRSRSRT